MLPNLAQGGQVVVCAGLFHVLEKAAFRCGFLASWSFVRLSKVCRSSFISSRRSAMASAMVGGTSRARCDPIVGSDGGQPQAGPQARAHGCVSPCVGLCCRGGAASSVFTARQTLLRPRLGLGAAARWALMRSSRTLAGSSAGFWGTSSPRPHRRERWGTAAGWAGRPRPREGARQGLGRLMRWAWQRLGRESNAFAAAFGLGSTPKSRTVWKGLKTFGPA